MTPRQVEYKAYLKTPHWRELRSEVLNRDNHRCTRCPSTQHLQAHHVRYCLRFEDSVAADLVTLCRGCHKAEHGIYPKKQPKVGMPSNSACKRFRKERNKKHKAWLSKYRRNRTSGNWSF